MEAGTIYGYCVGEPWNQQAVFKDWVPVVTAGKSVRRFQEWARTSQYSPGVVKALILRGHWLDENNNANRPEAVKILAQPNYVGADAVIANSMTGTSNMKR